MHGYCHHVGVRPALQMKSQEGLGTNEALRVLWSGFRWERLLLGLGTHLCLLALTLADDVVELVHSLRCCGQDTGGRGHRWVWGLTSAC